jgi:hypothetical protein
VVGRCYPPEFFSWVKIPQVRNLFERIAIETEEDYQAIISKLKEFNVEVLRPDLDLYLQGDMGPGPYPPPPMTPRDHMVMIGDTLYEHWSSTRNLTGVFKEFYSTVRDSSWPDCDTFEDFCNLPEHIQQECQEVHGMHRYINPAIPGKCYDKIFDHVRQQGNKIKSGLHHLINGATVARLGKDLYFGTEENQSDIPKYRELINQEFTNTRNFIVDTKGHTDATFCPVCPGLIISLEDAPTYANTFPGWEVVYLPNQSWSAVKPFLDLKEHNQGRWWIPGFEYDTAVTDFVETYLSHWTGYVEETVFDVNMLIIDPKNVIVFNYNERVFEALHRYGITPHIVHFRHRYFWDGGIHCVTLDLHREGQMKNVFPDREN